MCRYSSTSVKYSYNSTRITYKYISIKSRLTYHLWPWLDRMNAIKCLTVAVGSSSSSRVVSVAIVVAVVVVVPVVVWHFLYKVTFTSGGAEKLDSLSRVFLPTEGDGVLTGEGEDVPEGVDDVWNRAREVFGVEGLGTFPLAFWNLEENTNQSKL